MAVDPAPALAEAPQPLQPRTWPVRPPPPEQRSATATKQEAALETAVQMLENVGLKDAAQAIRQPMGARQKERGPEKPGARLDACQAFVTRAERRAQLAAEDVVAAEQALQVARDKQKELYAELAAGQARLEELRASMRGRENEAITGVSSQAEGMHEGVQMM
eukprot:694602-Karenia_brevis.AAC.1